MKITIKWTAPIRLKNGSSQNMIYCVDDLESFPVKPGIYVFLRIKGGKPTPLYIGQASKIRKRLRSQLNNLKLMMGIKNAPGKRRYVAYAVYEPAPGQNRQKVLNVIENALIRFAMAEGHDLLNIQGTKLREHVITSSGNKMSRLWFPKEMAVEKKRKKKA